MRSASAIPDPKSEPKSEQVLASFHQMERHPRWIKLSWLYLLTGLVACFLSVGPMSFVELSVIPVGVAFFVSINVVWPVMKWWLRQPLLWLLATWAAWMALSLLWSSNPAKGVWEWSSLRFAGFIVALWPLMRQRRALIYALAAGFIAANVSQLVLWLGHTLDLPWLMFRPWHPRNPGFWSHATVCGYMYVAALGLHLPAAMMGTGRTRLFAIAASIATILGSIATGARGAWIAAAALIGLVALVALIHHWRGRSLLIAFGTLVLAVAIAWFAAGDSFMRRANEGIAEVRSALTQQQYETDTGARFKFAKWALDMSKEKPLQGHGAGSYETWVRSRLTSEGTDPASVRTAPQAHNLWLHTTATLGLLGLALAVAIAWTATHSAFSGLTATTLGTYDAGPAFALIGLLLVTPFEVAYVNTPPSALLAILFALCLKWRPPLLTKPASFTTGTLPQ